MSEDQLELNETDVDEEEENKQLKDELIVVEDDKKKRIKKKKRNSKKFLVLLASMFFFFAVFFILFICAIVCYEKFMRESSVEHMIIVISVFICIFFSYFVANLSVVVFCKK